MLAPHYSSSLYSRLCHAWAVLRRKYAGLRCAVSVRLLLEVYTACVPPAGLYVCELWALRCLPRQQKDDRDNLASYHIHVLRAISGIRKSIPHIMLYLELQQAPLDNSWWVRVIQFWNNLAARPDSCIYKRVALSNCRAAFSGVQNWARSLMQSLLKLNHQFVLHCDRMDPIDHHRVMQLLNERLLAVTQDLDTSPRTCPTQNAVLCTYMRYFHRPPFAPTNMIPNPYKLPVPVAKLHVFLRFRTGCHNLPIVLGRFARVPRSQRLCTACHIAQLGDERHLVFECPALQHVRQRYSYLFTDNNATMISIFWQENMRDVVYFVLECLQVLIP